MIVPALDGGDRDALSLLSIGASWIRGRLDRLEFLDLTTVHRTIAFTLDLNELSRQLRLVGESMAFPVALFKRGAIRTAIRLEDASGAAVPYLTQAESDDRVREALARRLNRLGLDDNDDLLRHLREHMPTSCRLLCNEKGEFDGYADLAAEKWGCPAAGRLLRRLRDARSEEENRDQVTELIRLMFDWQNNFVLFVRWDAVNPRTNPETLEFSYEEELQKWQPPWERRTDALGRWDLQDPAGVIERSRIGRAPFGEDLDALAPMLGLREGPTWWRALGRQGPLSLAWHVAWQHSSSRDVAFQLVEVKLPPQLAVIRMRMVEASLSKGSGGQMKRQERVVAAPLSGARTRSSRARLLAPLATEADSNRFGPLVGTFASLVVAQRGRSAWLVGAVAALLTGCALFVAAFAELRSIDSQAGAAVTILLLVPTLGAALLSISAASTVTQILTTPLWILIAAVAVIAVGCAVDLITQPTPAPGALLPGSQLTGLETEWIVGGALLFLITLVLIVGWVELGRQLRYRDPLPSAGPEPVDIGRALLAGDAAGNVPSGAPRIRPPDVWSDGGEGDRIPWGWLWHEAADAPALQTRAGQGFGEDTRYWNAVYERPPNAVISDDAVALVEWRERQFTSKLAQPPILGLDQPEPALANTDHLTLLERLGALRDAAVLTPEEFQSEKNRILADDARGHG